MLYHAVPYNTVQHDRDKDRSSTVKVDGEEHPDEILTLHSQTQLAAV